MVIREQRFSFNQVRQVLGGVLEHDLHAKRVELALRCHPRRDAQRFSRGLHDPKRRVHSLFRQGCMLYDLIPMMPETRLRPLIQRFSRMLHEQPLFADVFGPI